MRKYFTKQYLREKQIKQFYREYEKLRNNFKTYPLKKLDIPIHRGWNIEFTINPNLKSNTYNWVNECLMYFSHEYKKNNSLKKHIRTIRELRELKYLKRIDKEAIRFPIKIFHITTEKLQDTIHKLLIDYYYDDRYFYFTIEKYPFFKNFTIALFLKQEYCKTKISKNLIYEIKDIDPLLLQREAELRPYVELYWKYNYGHYKKSKWDREDKKLFFKTKYNYDSEKFTN